ncbi:MADF domain-containing protein [Camponotus japonicus]
MPNVWSGDDTEKLIALYGQYQCLWNPFHPEFNSTLSRYRAYKKIKNSINIPGLTICDCIEKITNVKKEYCYELSKITAAIFCEKLYAPKAEWFKRMHVLFFPYIPTSSYNDLKKPDSNKQKFNDISTQDDLLHSSLEKSKDKANVCSNDICGTCELQEIELCLKLRDTIHSTSKPQDALIFSEAIQMIDVATDISNGVHSTTENETQTDMFNDRSTFTDDISVEMYSRRKTEDSFDLFGKTIAFQLRTVDIKTAMELEKEIQNLITKARLKTLESKLMDRNGSSVCCCDCNDCKVMCKNETCNCGLTLKECLLLTKIKRNKGYEFCYK